MKSSPARQRVSALLYPEVEEVYYLLQGEAEMEVDGQVEMVGPGDKEVCYQRSGLMYVVIADL